MREKRRRIKETAEERQQKRREERNNLPFIELNHSHLHNVHNWIEPTVPIHTICKYNGLYISIYVQSGKFVPLPSYPYPHLSISMHSLCIIIKNICILFISIYRLLAINQPAIICIQIDRVEHVRSGSIFISLLSGIIFYNLRFEHSQAISKNLRRICSYFFE